MLYRMQAYVSNRKNNIDAQSHGLFAELRRKIDSLVFVDRSSLGHAERDGVRGVRCN